VSRHQNSEKFHPIQEQFLIKNMKCFYIILKNNSPQIEWTVMLIFLKRDLLLQVIEQYLQTLRVLASCWRQSSFLTIKDVGCTCRILRKGPIWDWFFGGQAWIPVRETRLYGEGSACVVSWSHKADVSTFTCEITKQYSFIKLYCSYLLFYKYIQM